MYSKTVGFFLHLFIPALVAVFTILASDSTIADMIAWDTPVTITGDSDVSTNGAFVGSGNLADSSLSLNGVTFSGITFSNGVTTVTSNNFEFSVVSDGILGVDETLGSIENPFGSLSMEYQDLLDSGMFTHSPGNDPAAITLEISNLSIGHMYEFQWWVNDSRDSGDFDRTTTATAGNSVALQHNVANVEGGVGQYVIGTFTADATTQQIVFQGAGTGPNDGSTQINAYQLRAISAIPEPASTALLGIFVVFGMCQRRQRPV